MTEFMDAVKPKESAQRQHVYNATVSRIEDGVVYVYLTGAETDTPTALSASEVKRGDAVTVEWRNNRLYIAGNTSNPAVGASRVAAVENDAQRAQTAAASAVESAATASEAAAQAVSDAATAQSAAETATNSLKSVVSGATTVEKAVSVMQTALEAVVDYDPQTDTTKEYFWHDANGAHVLGTSGDYRNDIDSTGMKIVDTATEQAVAEFGTDGAVFRDEGVENFRVSQSGASSTTTLYKTLKVTAYAGTWRSSFMRISGVSGTITAKMGNRTTTFHYGTNRAVTYTDGSVEVTIRYDGADKITLEVNNRTGDAAVTYTVEATYTASVDAPYYSVGTRTGSAGGFSAIIGEGLQAETDDQIAVGKFNDNQSTNIFEVGNGTDDGNRANAFSIDHSGNVSASGDITDGTGNVLSAKADASGMFITRTATASGTIGGNTNGRITGNITSVSGYSPIAIMGVTSNAGAAATITEFGLYNNLTQVSSVVRNVSSSQISVTHTYRVLYAKASLIS